MEARTLTLSRPQYSADWGDYISFAQRLREKADEKGVDLLVVDCGDRVDGNGLYDASTPKGKYTYDVIREQHIDVITTGNHELYQADTAAREYDQTVPNFHGNYLASNLDYLNPKTGERIAMAQRYRTFTTKNLGLKVVAFGFLFDFTGNANNTFVQPVSKTIQEQWFQDAIREEADLFLVAGHVTLNGPEYDAIFRAIRKQNWDTPIHFFGGHSHIRSYHKYDTKAYGIQAGRYLETIGWASIDGISKKKKKKASGKGSPELRSAAAELFFGRRYIDANLYGYHYHTGLNESTFPTGHGKNISSIMRSSRKTLKLDHTFGCAPKDLWLNRAPYPSVNSLLSWLDQEVMPAVVVNNDRKHVPRLAMTNSGAMRFDIFKGAFTTDTTYIISPFVSKFRYIKDVPYKSAKRLLDLINNEGQIFQQQSLQTLALSPPEQLSAQLFDKSAYAHPGSEDFKSQMILTHKPSLIPGYTTSDAAGTDGDDTVHSPIKFYRVPNVVQSKLSFPRDKEPEKVDVVYIDFIQPWILVALNFLGESVTSADTLSLRNETLTELLASWIKDNWRSNC